MKEDFIGNYLSIFVPKEFRSFWVTTLTQKIRQMVVVRKENGIVHMSVEGSLDLLRSRNMGIKSNEIQHDENFLLNCITKFLAKNRVKKIELKTVFKDPA